MGIAIGCNFRGFVTAVQCLENLLIGQIEYIFGGLQDARFGEPPSSFDPCVVQSGPAHLLKIEPVIFLELIGLPSLSLFRYFHVLGLRSF
jgi:hypothetical protein